MNAARRALLHAIREHGRDAVSFQAIEDHVLVFEHARGLVAYVDTGSAYLAIGRPLARGEDVREVAGAFVAHARARRRRVCFVGVEDRDFLPGAGALSLGEQPEFVPAEWPSTLAAHRSLREQLRRARAKGVRVRVVAAEELAPGSPLRARVRELAVAWLASRRVEPLQFLLALEPFHAPEDHLYVVAERAGRVIAFASAIPIPARDGFMLEDVLREADVPNGTTELVFDAAIAAAGTASIFTPGLAPLTGPVPSWLRLLRTLTRPLFDFDGLRAFKARMHPSRWVPVYLILPAGESGFAHFIECLRAFAGGSIVRFGFLSLLRHESGPPWALVLPLVLWIGLRLLLAAAGEATRFGSAPAAVVAWSALDAVLAVLLFLAALRPTARRLLAAALVAALVAARAAVHVLDVGLGEHPFDVALRALMVLAPSFGSLALAWSAHRRRRYERGQHAAVSLPHF